MTNAALPRSPAPAASCDVRIVAEQAVDVFAREILLDEAFGAARFRKTCERLRVGRAPARGLALAAHDDGCLIGTVRLWHVRAGGVPALMLGPLAVAKSHRGLGIGDMLMRNALSRATVRGHRAIILVGDAPYYAKFGFSREAVADLTMPGPVELDRFLGLELAAGALADANGRVIATGEKAGRATSVGLRREVDRCIAAGG